MEYKDYPAPADIKRHAYILRLWEDIDSQKWHASLLNTSTEELIGFGEVGHMLEIILQLTGNRGSDD